MNSIRKILDKILEVACILIFGIMTIFVVYQVVTRYVFQSPSSWSESVVTYGFIWLAMLGGAYVFGKRDHMAMTFVLDKFHGRVKKARNVALLYLRRFLHSLHPVNK